MDPEDLSSSSYRLLCGVLVRLAEPVQPVIREDDEGKMQQGLDHLTGLLARDDTVLFVGSGVSTWSGLPTWSGLLLKLRDELVRLGRQPTLVERELKNGDLLLAASYGVDQMTPQERCHFLRNSIPSGIGEPSELHSAIATLGPSCFVTTNYDNLLERTLLAHRASENFDVVTPAHTLEIPSIVQARASHFIFKPHGDIGNCDSIVFTREDYRELQGRRRSVFEATRTLLASRPVVFLGFGLRDPDFLLMRDMLFNTFDSNPSDHVALMPDVHEDERRYWRRNYGIELVGYQTDMDAPVESRHRKLLELIRTARSSATVTSPQALATDTAMLTLARHGRGLLSEIADPHDTDVPLTISLAKSARWDAADRKLDRAMTGEASNSLAMFGGHAIVEGPPGSGKSHTLSKLTRKLAADLESACLLGNPASLHGLRVPVLVAMRDYRGKLEDLLEKSLPVDVTLDSLLERKIGYIMLDGLNEAPIALGQENLLNEQVGRLLQAAADNTVIITTRFARQISSFDLPVLTLDAVEESALRSGLAAEGIDPGRLNPITFDLLRRPLFYVAWISGKISVQETQTIHDVYIQLMANFEKLAKDKLSMQIPMTNTLGKIAFSMIEGGDLSASLGQVLTTLKATLPANVDPDSFYQYLLSSGMLVATPLRRLAFYHHSITEYLAASHLAQRIRHDRSSVIECLGRRDWDQSLLLSLGFLEGDVANSVHESIMNVDAVMGLRSLHFVEADQESWIDRGLRLVPDDLDFSMEFPLALVLAGLPVSEFHILALDSLAERDTHLGGVALGMSALVDVTRLEDSVGFLTSGEKGYNFSNGLAEILSRIVDIDLGSRIIDRLESVEIPIDVGNCLLNGSEIDQYVAIKSSVGKVLSALPLDVLIRRAENSTSPLVRVTLATALRRSCDFLAVQFFLNEIERGARYAIVDLYFQIEFGRSDDELIPDVSRDLIRELISAIDDPTVGRWSLSALRALVERNSDIREMINPASRTGLAAALLQYATGDGEGFYRQMLMLSQNVVNWDDEPVDALDFVEEWRADVLISLLSLRNDALAAPLLNSLKSDPFDEMDLDIDLESLEWWLDWLNDMAEARSFTASDMGRFLGRNTSAKTRSALLDVFNDIPWRRGILADWVLPNFLDVGIDELSEGSVQWLIVRLSERGDDWHESVLSRVATEEMVQDRFIPLLLANPDAITKRNVVRLLHRAGRRHGRRYIGDDGEVLS